MSEISDPQTARRVREQRIHRLRMRIAAVAVALFVAAWTGLFVQLVSGHDPALAGDIAPVSQSADPAAATDDTTGDGWSDDTSSTGTDPATSDATQASQPAAVTTGQS